MNDFSKFKEYPSGPYRTTWCIQNYLMYTDKQKNVWLHKQMFEDVTSNTEDQSSENAIQTH